MVQSSDSVMAATMDLYADDGFLSTDGQVDSKSLGRELLPIALAMVGRLQGQACGRVNPEPTPGNSSHLGLRGDSGLGFYFYHDGQG